MTKLLLDSWILIEAFKGGGKLPQIKKLLAGKQLFTTTLSLYEVFYRMDELFGEETAQKVIQAISLDATILTIEMPLAIKAAQLRKGLKLQNKNLGAIDLLTYAAAQSIGATLVTGDPDFKKISGVVLV